MSHAMEEYTRCLCRKSNHSLKDKMKNKANIRHFYFRKAKARLDHDLDISGLLQIRNGFEILKSIIFDEDDLWLQSFQKRLVINSDTDSDLKTDFERERQTILTHNISGAELVCHTSSTIGVNKRSA